MRMKHTTLATLMVVVLLVVMGAVFMRYHTALRFTFAENAVLNGQSITIPVNLNDLTDLSKPALPQNSAQQEAMQPHIAILVTGLGLDEKITRAAVSLPAAVALGFSPYAVGLQEWAGLASSHPVLLEVPIDVSGGGTAKRGVHDLQIHAEAADNTAHLEWILARFSGYAGVYTKLDAKTLLSLKNIRAFLDSLKARNLLFVHGAGDNEELQRLASGVPLSVLEANTVIEGDVPVAAAALTEIEQAADESGQALVVVNASPESLEALQEWMATLEAKGLKIVPLTDIVRKIE